MVAKMIIDNRDFGIGYSNSNDNKSFSINEENYFNLPWSISKIEDELVLHLSSYSDAEIMKILVLSTAIIIIKKLYLNIHIKNRQKAYYIKLILQIDL